MSVEIIKVYKEKLPAHRIVGKKYTEDDRVEGNFSAKWGEWFENGWFEEIEKLDLLPEGEGAYIGAMRCVDNIFEYWIGILCTTGTSTPEGFSSADIAEGDIAACWVYGKESNGEIFGVEPYNMCLGKIAEAGWQLQDNGWFFEWYNCPRYTEPDEKGNVILDYCFYIL